ncbi:Cysteinyl-tRNA synthetase [Metamycoplasma auris 15026]|uniref:Cysteine--tRNA ligase n=1 Tax=Metamycoplasma auris 15026 TaxID=1188233 RepID=N9TSI3_9BACT|nr:cysteine--tRNA ligase [Metamycoplasma auris]ENY69114.1 Cysteinyl-tRNA synthetase [Metamycoplasma auris 15026]
MKKYYLCGPTVYNYPHIGNLRPTVTFDLLIRAQKHLGQEIFYLNNITDIDDKIIKKAMEENTTEAAIAKKYEDYYLSLFDSFNLIKPTQIVRVTDSLNDIYQYIQKMLDSNAAYQVGGNVFFDVQQFRDVYGKISNQRIENLVAEEDTALDLKKKNKADFTLWKDTNLGIKFESPFGLGRPGWHTECSCFIAKYFNGETIDLHGGGIDLIFPHHENENIQHYAIYKKPITKNWMHFGTLNYKNQKMSKSIGNLIFPHDFLKKYDVDTYKLLMLTTNYSKPINLTDELLQSIQSIINKFQLISNKNQLNETNVEPNTQKINEVIFEVANLNFAGAYKEIIQLSKKEADIPTFLAIMNILGFIFPSKKINKKDKNLYLEWKNLVENKNYKKADLLRDILKEKKLI